MTDSSLRTAIARALLDSNGETDCDHCYGLALRDADAVLKVLANPPAEVLERAARVYESHSWNPTPQRCSCGEFFAATLEGHRLRELHKLQVAIAALVGGGRDEA